MYPYPPPQNTPEDYLSQFQRLLPRGRIWHRGWGWMQDADLLTLMPTWSRLQTGLNELITQIFPCSTTELLPEWEASLGLPDPCTGELPTMQQRTAAVCGKFAARGGQSREYFIHLAASLGFNIVIETYSPFYASRNRAGDPCCDEQWAYAWRVIADPTQVLYFLASYSAAGDPLATWGNKLLECEFENYKPAHTQIVFSYILAESQWDTGNSIWDQGDSIWDERITVDGEPN
jgi:uncharacterized protein YmfQ (DUF2313 family)